MGLYTVEMWRLGCDFPGCGKAAQDDTECHAWADKDGAVHDAECADWTKGPDTTRPVPYYCTEHPTIWASELEARNDDERVEGVKHLSWPFLLINDISRLAAGEVYVAQTTTDLCALLDRLENS